MLDTLGSHPEEIFNSLWQWHDFFYTQMSWEFLSGLDDTFRDLLEQNIKTFNYSTGYCQNTRHGQQGLSSNSIQS